MNAEVLNHAIQEIITTNTKLADLYRARIKGDVRQGDNVDLYGLVCHFAGIAAGMRELAFRISLLDSTIESEV